MDQERLIVCNTSPLINLAEIGLLDVLENLPGLICIPTGVRDEIIAKAELFTKAAEAVTSDRFQLIHPKDGLLVRSFAAMLHRGEAECLALGAWHGKSRVSSHFG